MREYTAVEVEGIARNELQSDLVPFAILRPSR